MIKILSNTKIQVFNNIVFLLMKSEKLMLQVYLFYMFYSRKIERPLYINML